MSFLEDSTWDEICVMVCVFILFALMVFGVFGALITYVPCADRWKLSGYAARYERDFGCVVEVAPGRWVPESAVRVVP